MTPELPPPPKVEDCQPHESWEHYGLYLGVQDALAALPVHFTTETHIAGVNATDLHTLNNVLGAAIEDQVVATLNAIRHVWDPDDDYSLYSFVRQPQTFPDVLLRRSAADKILLGIELKGWYVLAKEGEPSFRYQITPAACAPADLVAVVPWALGQVLSGRPRVFEPYVVPARFAAEYRNYHWQYVRQTKLDTAITHPEGVSPYPTKSDHVADRPAADSGGNFGRFARSGVMDEYLAAMKSRNLAGIQVQHWQEFLSAFHEKATDDTIRSSLETLRVRMQETLDARPAAREAMLTIVRGLEGLLESEEP